jgi:hypothetical protein
MSCSPRHDQIITEHSDEPRGLIRSPPVTRFASVPGLAANPPWGGGRQRGKLGAIGLTSPYYLLIPASLCQFSASPTEIRDWLIGLLAPLRKKKKKKNPEKGVRIALHLMSPPGLFPEIGSMPPARPSELRVHTRHAVCIRCMVTEPEIGMRAGGIQGVWKVVFGWQGGEGKG